MSTRACLNQRLNLQIIKRLWYPLGRRTPHSASVAGVTATAFLSASREQTVVRRIALQAAKPRSCAGNWSSPFDSTVHLCLGCLRLLSQGPSGDLVNAHVEAFGQCNFGLSFVLLTELLVAGDPIKNLPAGMWAKRIPTLLVTSSWRSFLPAGP